MKPPTRLPVPKSATSTVLGMPPRPDKPRSEPRTPVDAPVDALVRSESKAPSERPRIASAKSTVRGQPIEKPKQDSERPRIESATKTVMGVGSPSAKSKRKWVIDDDESTEALRVAAQRRTRTYYLVGGAIAIALVLVVLVALAK